MDKWYWQLCLCSKGLQLMWIWWGVQRGCMSEGVLSLQMLWTCIFLKTVSWYLSGHIPHKLSTRGFNEHRRLTKRVGYIAQTSRLLFPPKKKQIFWIMSWAKIEFFHAEIYVTYSIIVICSLLVGIDCLPILTWCWPSGPFSLHSTVMEKIAWERDDLSFMFVDPTEPIIKQNFIWVLSRSVSGGSICTPV